MSHRLLLYRPSNPRTMPVFRSRSSGYNCSMYLRSPCADWITTKSFIALKPAYITPRRPAVPKFNRFIKRFSSVFHSLRFTKLSISFLVFSFYKTDEKLFLKDFFFVSMSNYRTLSHLSQSRILPFKSGLSEYRSTPLLYAMLCIDLRPIRFPNWV